VSQGEGCHFVVVDFPIATSSSTQWVVLPMAMANGVLDEAKGHPPMVFKRLAHLATKQF
jgi:hypothetical protein